MEPNQDREPQEQTQAQQSEPRKPRFRLVKLEERIAPSHKGGHTNGGGCDHGFTWKCRPSW